MSAKLYLIPNSISEQDHGISFAKNEISGLRVFFVEEIRSARRLLKKIDPQFPVDDCRFFDLNEHTSAKETEKNFREASDKDIGVISEAGCPCVADPGAEVVLLAHKAGREVIPLLGPSSILLALMASGLNGQNFAFNGYLPKEKIERVQKLKALEKRSVAEKQTQIFMEAPYRNQNLFEDILQTCSADTRLCVAVDLGTPSQLIRTRTIRDWKSKKIEINKRPAVFLIGQQELID